MADEPLIRDITDTARWVATYRARESERPDAVFRDPYARRLAGDRGEQIIAAMPLGDQNQWVFTARTLLFDRFLAAELAAGADVVINLGAGLDARPYRMDVLSTLTWIEVDLPAIVDYKSRVLAGEPARCALERVPLDLSDVPSRRALFERLGRTARRAVLLSEGVLLYLSEDEVASLGRDLHAQPSFERWVIDVVSPALLAMMQQYGGALVAQAGAPYTFGPREGPRFFERFGWRPIEVESLIAAAAAAQRTPPWFLPSMAAPYEFKDGHLQGLWSGACILTRT